MAKALSPHPDTRALAGFHLEKLEGAEARHTLLAHYTELDSESRAARFFLPVSTDSLDYLLARSNPEFILAARRADLVVAVCEVYRIDPTMGEIGVSVLDDFQGRGLAHALIDSAMVHARDIGLSEIIAHTRRGDSVMPHLLQTLGGTLNRTLDGTQASLRL